VFVTDTRFGKSEVEKAVTTGNTFS
jgi:hypothetical protein